MFAWPRDWQGLHSREYPRGIANLVLARVFNVQVAGEI